MSNKFHSLQEAKDFINREAVAYIDHLLSLSTNIIDIDQNFIWHNNQAGTFGMFQVKRMRRNEMLVNTEFDVQKIESNFYATKSYYYLLFRPLMRLTWACL